MGFLKHTLHFKDTTLVPFELACAGYGNGTGLLSDEV